MDIYEPVRKFESEVAKYAGSMYAVAVDSCTNAIFLCCKYLKAHEVTIPAKTYVSVPCSIIHAGGKVKFSDYEWKEKGFYQLLPYPIYDGAHMFSRGMYVENSFFCISFSYNKTVNIGKGGMILTNDENAVTWFKQARYCGRHERDLLGDEFDVVGWNMYMTPEQASRGLNIMLNVKDANPPKIKEYPDLSKFKIYG